MAMPAGRLLLLVLLAAGLSRGEESAAPAPASPAHTVASLDYGEGTDLDFSDDFIPPSKRARRAPKFRKGKLGRLPAPPPAPLAASAEPGPEPGGSQAWLWWTLGLTAVSGGAAAWYVHREMDGAPAPTRTEEVFTDGAP